MKKQFVRLALALVVLLVIVAAASLKSGETQHQQPSYVVATASPASPEMQPARQASGVPTEPTSPAEYRDAEREREAVVKTGCGKPTPCPGRSCEDCPHNRLLK